MSPCCSPAPSSSLALALLSVLVVVLAALSSLPTTEAKTVMLGGGGITGAEREIRAEGAEGEMTDALKYLEELDKYYSQVARPRERRVGQNVAASALEKLSQIKNYYNEAGRPSPNYLMSPMSYYYNSRAFPPTLVRMAVPEPDYVQQAAAPISVGPSKRSRNSVSQPEQQAVEIPAEAMMRLRRSEAAAVGPAPEEEEKEIGVYRRSIDKLKTLQNIDSDLIHMARPRFGKRSRYPAIDTAMPYGRWRK